MEQKSKQPIQKEYLEALFLELQELKKLINSTSGTRKITLKLRSSTTKLRKCLVTFLTLRLNFRAKKFPKFSAPIVALLKSMELDIGMLVTMNLFRSCTVKVRLNLIGQIAPIFTNS